MGWQPETQPKGKPPVEKTKGAETMQRLIYANEAIDALTKRWNRTINFDGPGVDIADECRMVLNKVPTIDAEPVRHGKWIVTNEGVVKCSECKRKFILLKENYCPNCGARMDEE